MVLWMITGICAAADDGESGCLGMCVAVVLLLLWVVVGVVGCGAGVGQQSVLGEKPYLVEGARVEVGARGGGN